MPVYKGEYETDKTSKGNSGFSRIYRTNGIPRAWKIADHFFFPLNAVSNLKPWACGHLTGTQPRAGNSAPANTQVYRASRLGMSQPAEYRGYCQPETLQIPEYFCHTGTSTLCSV
jgi:hypothetical protein